MEDHGDKGQPSCVIEEIVDDQEPAPQNVVRPNKSDNITTQVAINQGQQAQHPKQTDQPEPLNSENEPPGALNIADAPELRGETWGHLGPLNPPPDGCEKVTEDGGVLKKVLVEGFGEVPKQYARCLVHYLGRLQSNAAIFMDSKTESHSQQPVTVVAGRSASPRETGLYAAVAKMRTGERAAVYVQDPVYGYGAEGSFSFPAVPPSAALTYEVELVDWEDPDKEDAEVLGGDGAAGLLYEERLERAEARRLIGNELFAQGRYREAMGKYAVALSYMDEDFMMQLEGHYEDKANAVKVPIHLNMAACQLKIKDYHTAIYNCGEVLKLEPGHVKALFRRGAARHALGQTEAAFHDLTAAAEKAPGDAAVARELAALKVTMREEKRAQAKLFKGHFGTDKGVFKDGEDAAASSSQVEGAAAGQEGAPAVGSKRTATAGTGSAPGVGKDARPDGQGSATSAAGARKAAEKSAKPEPAPEVQELRARMHSSGARGAAGGMAAQHAQRGAVAAIIAWLVWLAGLLGLRLRARSTRAAGKQ